LEFYTYFYKYKYTRRLHLENCYVQSFLEAEFPTDFINRFWIQVAFYEVKRKTAFTWPFRKCSGHKFITVVCNGHSPTANGRKCPFGCSGHATATAVSTAVDAGQSQRFYSGVGIFNLYYLNSPPQILKNGKSKKQEQEGSKTDRQVGWAFVCQAEQCRQQNTAENFPRGGLGEQMLLKRRCNREIRAQKRAWLQPAQAQLVQLRTGLGAISFAAVDSDCRARCWAPGEGPCGL
jgi:hypothetical protein